ncbi:RTC4-like domain-containing protein [Mycena sp. CBHHK59/15]|nr:RTC4-like domain-containing protein [Mycena sp. CBHHK59/15]
MLMERNAFAKTLESRPFSQPSRSQKTRGVLNEDLGSGFDLPRSQGKERATRTRIVDSDSDDELNAFSQTRVSPSQPPVSLPPPVRPDTDDVIKTMKFKKNKPAGTDPQSSTSKAPMSKENARRASDKKSISGDTSSKNAIASTSQPLREKPNRRHSPPLVRPVRPQTFESSRNGELSQAKERPKPRPLVKQTKTVPLKPSSSTRIDSPSTPVPSKLSKTKDCPLDTMSPLAEVGDNAKGKGKEKGQNKPQKGRKATQDFPGLSPLSSPVKRSGPPSSWPSPLDTPASRDKDLKRTSSRLATTDFPAPSPLHRKGRAEPSRKEAYAASDAEASGSKAVRPFPMSTQVLDTIGSPGPSTPVKRRSIGSGSDDEGERDRKRYKNQPVGLADPYDYEEDSELLFISPDTDPNTLCPYCDTPLPAMPTPLLKRLLDQTFKKSYRDVRPTNPLGRKAPINVFVTVCQRHRFESETLPEAEARGWPKQIDWTGLKGRVRAMKRDLALIIDDPGDPIVYYRGEEQESRTKKLKEKEETPEEERRKSPRMRCIFWQEMVKEVKTQGSKGVKGVRGQFANFEKTQPGYYGELGSVIIHQTLYDMFPLAAINPDLVSPLTPNEFIQRILVPEVGMRLVMQDLLLEVDELSDKKQAVAVLRESASYGVAMFPEDGGEWAGVSGKKKEEEEEEMGVAELMVMERARKRRKELEIEEREEDEMWRLQQAKEEAKKEKQKAEIAKEKRRAKRKAREQEVESIVVAPIATRPRPRPKFKPTPATGSGMDTDTSSSSGRNDDDSDVDMVATVKRPRAAARRRDDFQVPPTDESDVEPEAFTVPPVKRPKSRSRSTRMASASSGSEHNEYDSDLAISDYFARPRSPSLTVTEIDSSRRPTRGSSVVDLCSSSEDGNSVAGSRTGRKERQRKSPIAPATPVFLRHRGKQGGSSLEDAETTPRARGQPPGKESRSSSVVATVGATSSTFVPLDAAKKRRAPTG